MTFQAWSNHNTMNVVQVTLGTSTYIVIEKPLDKPAKITVVTEEQAQQTIEELGLKRV